MAKKRNPRVDKAVREAVADLVESEVADPRLAFVTFTEAQVTPDHEHALVFYSTLDPGVLSADGRRGRGGDRVPTAAEVAEGLASVAPRLQGRVSRRAKLRTTPELTFEPDPVVEQASRVEDLLRRIEPVVPVEGAQPTGEYDDGWRPRRPDRARRGRRQHAVTVGELAVPWLADLDPHAVDEVVARLADAADHGRTVVIAAHVGPDGDALGAALALHLALSRRGARTMPTWGEEPLRVPAAYADLPGVDDLVAPSDIPVDEVDLLVSVDAASVSRLGALQPLLAAGVPIVVIDHHPTNTRFGTVHLVAPRAAATVVIVDELLRRLEVPLDVELATCLYVGLVTDTGRFQHASTDRAAMELGGRLLDAGVEHEELTRRLFGTRTVGELTLLARALDRLDVRARGPLGPRARDGREMRPRRARASKPPKPSSTWCGPPTSPRSRWSGARR